jgi:hypothetical protein
VKWNTHFFPAFNQYLFVPKFYQALWVTTKQVSLTLPRTLPLLLPLSSHISFLLTPTDTLLPAIGRIFDSRVTDIRAQCLHLTEGSALSSFHVTSVFVQSTKHKVWGEGIAFCLREKLLLTVF